MSVLSMFKLKPFDLEPIYASWPDGPRFLGNPKKDPPLDAWLEQIRKGCVERKVPEECWHKVAQHFMGDKALARLEELKLVLARMHGGKFRWTWKKFKIAMHNMSWEIDARQTETVRVKQKASGRWWITRKLNTTNAETKECPPTTRGRPTRAATTLERATSTSVHGRRAPARSQSTDNNDPAVTEVKNAPTWLLNACNALDFLTSEHPKTMTAISAILITIGSIPSIPAISAGAGGALLASGTAHAVGALAVGVGSMIKTAQVASHAKTASSSR